jgi:polyketide biosynthesis enoyl-CoA hydratase PksI
VDALGVLGRPGLLDVTISAQGVACVRMEDVARNNALSYEMVNALEEAFRFLGRDPCVRAIVLAGSPEIFSSGAGSDVLRDLVAGRRDSDELLLPRVLLECPVPCLAAMAGSAVGGGFAMGIAADLVFLGRESRYCLNFLNLGFTPGMGTTRLLEHVLSTAIAHELLYSGEARLGRDFEGRSGFNRVLPRSEVLPHSLALAERIAEKPRAALVALKGTLTAPRRQAFEAARTQEALMHSVSFAQPEVRRAIEEVFAVEP